MTMTDDRPAVIPGYAQTPEAQNPPTGGHHPPVDAGGSIPEVEAARNPGYAAANPRFAKEACDVCGKAISHKNLNQHKRNVHGIYKRKKRGAEPVAESDRVTVGGAPAKTPIKRAKVTVEEIIVTVVSIRWPNGVPVNKVTPLLQWAKDTERFLNE